MGLKLKSSFIHYALMKNLNNPLVAHSLDSDSTLSSRFHLTAP